MIKYKSEANMKTAKIFVYFLILAWIGLSTECFGQSKEIPITTSSKEALDLFLKGRDASEEYQFKKANELFGKAIQADPDFAMAHLYHSIYGGSYNIYRQNMDKAISLVDKVSPGEKLFILFVQAFFEGNVSKATEYINKLLTDFPSDKRVHLFAANYYAGLMNDNSSALKQFVKATEIDPDYANAYNFIGYSQMAMENYPEAEKAFKKYIELDPELPNAYDSYAELLLKIGKYDESIEQYRKALQLDPGFITSLGGVGNNYVFKGDFDAARKYYQEYYDKADNFDMRLNALELKAWTYLYQNEAAKAIKVIEECQALAEKENQQINVVLYYATQGFLLSESGNPAEGRLNYEKAIDLLGKTKLSESERVSMDLYSKLWHVACLIYTGMCTGI
jgi:tetratricopeptide (TPR) repeat protein